MPDIVCYGGNQTDQFATCQQNIRVAPTDRDSGAWTVTASGDTSGDFMLQCSPGPCPYESTPVPRGYDPVCCVIRQQSPLYGMLSDTSPGATPLPPVFTAGSATRFNFDNGYDQPQVENILRIDRTRTLRTLREVDMTIAALKAAGLTTGAILTKEVGVPYARRANDALLDMDLQRRSYNDVKAYIEAMQAHQQELFRTQQAGPNAGAGAEEPGADPLNQPLLPAADQAGARGRDAMAPARALGAAGRRATGALLQGGRGNRQTSTVAVDPMATYRGAVPAELLPAFIQAREQARAGEPITAEIPSWLQYKILDERPLLVEPVDQATASVQRSAEIWYRAAQRAAEDAGMRRVDTQRAELARRIGVQAGVPVNPQSDYIQALARITRPSRSNEAPPRQLSPEEAQARNAAWEAMSSGTAAQRMDALTAEIARAERLSHQPDYDAGYIRSLRLVGNPNRGRAVADPNFSNLSQLPRELQRGPSAFDGSSVTSALYAADAIENIPGAEGLTDEQLNAMTDELFDAAAPEYNPPPVEMEGAE